LGGCVIANPVLIGATTAIGALTGYIAMASSSNSNPGSSSSTPSEGTGDLLSAANKPVNDSGLSAAARALDKHAGRPGGSFAPLTGGVAEKNQAANKFVQGVLTNPTTIRTSLSRGGVEFRLPNGQGVRFNADGALSGFLDPKK
jgi:filamentous hemagglutinin